MPSDLSRKTAEAPAAGGKPSADAAQQAETPAPDADKDEPVPHERPPVRSDDN